jgi:uncharacterized membrane protein YjjP (DUF1212 family)
MQPDSRALYIASAILFLLPGVSLTNSVPNAGNPNFVSILPSTALFSIIYCIFKTRLS